MTTAGVVTSLLVTSIQACAEGQFPLVIFQQSVLTPKGRLSTVATGLFADGVNKTPGGPVHVPVSPGITGDASTENPFELHTS